MVSCPSSTIQMSRSLCLKPKPFLDDPNSCNRAPVQQKTLFVNFIINVHSVLTIVVNGQVKNMKDVTDEIVKVDVHFTSKLSFDKGLQVLKDVLSYTHFQFIWSKIDYKETIRITYEYE